MMSGMGGSDVSISAPFPTLHQRVVNAPTGQSQAKNQDRTDQRRKAGKRKSFNTDGFLKVR
jgi:hypothetical protein